MMKTTLIIFVVVGIILTIILIVGLIPTQSPTNKVDYQPETNYDQAEKKIQQTIQDETGKICGNCQTQLLTRGKKGRC